MSKDHIKSGLADTTDWENEGRHASNVYYRGCLIGYILELNFQRNHGGNQPFAHDMQYGEEKIDSRRGFTVSKHALQAPQNELLVDITILNRGNIIGNFRDFYNASMNYLNHKSTFDNFGRRFGANHHPIIDHSVSVMEEIKKDYTIFNEFTRCVVLNRSGKMIFNSNNEIESTALATSCEFIENSFGYCLDLIRKDPDMCNRFRTAVYGEFADEVQFEANFEFNFSEQNYVYGTHFLTAMNTCFANMAKIVPTLGKISRCSFHLQFKPLKDVVHHNTLNKYSKFQVQGNDVISIQRNVRRGRDVLDLSPVQGIGTLESIPDMPLLLQTIVLRLSRHNLSYGDNSVFERSWDD